MGGGETDALGFLFYCVLDTLDDRSLPLGAHLLGALEGDEGDLEVVGGLLQGCLVSWLAVPGLNRDTLAAHRGTHQGRLERRKLLQVV